MAGLSLITSHTKAYADQNCGNRGSGVTVIQHSDKPIVCDKSSGTRILSSTSGGRDIEIDMDRHSREEAAVTVTGAGTNITIIAKKLTVKGGSGSGDKPVIKVYDGGALTLNEEVDVTRVTGMIKKEIVVDGQGSSVTLNGVLKGFEGVQVKNGGMVTLMKDVAFNNGSEAGIKITGDRDGKATVMGNLKTMTVKGNGGDGVGIQMEGTGKIDATVMMLKIKGTGSGKGVDMQGTGEMELNKVGIEGFKMGVNARSGTVDINGKSTITVANSGTGIMVSGNGATVSMTQGKIEGGGGSG
ncbi:hypothetical protein, partial [Bartonella bovis]|uniref:hypothetical protein n=1 Tax=Bartonella bovis TaxID=155194 RepID=UPI0011AF7F62